MQQCKIKKKEHSHDCCQTTVNSRSGPKHIAAGMVSEPSAVQTVHSNWWKECPFGHPRCGMVSQEKTVNQWPRSVCVGESQTWIKNNSVGNDCFLWGVIVYILSYGQDQACTFLGIIRKRSSLHRAVHVVSNWQGASLKRLLRPGDFLLTDVWIPTICSSFKPFMKSRRTVARLLLPHRPR